MRADVLIFKLGLAKSRQAAKELIGAGDVFCGGVMVNKASLDLPEDARIEIKGGVPEFVGRGGLKLKSALDTFGINPSGCVCADIGASTGGFTDCLLQRGAARVYAIDCGTGQLDEKLRRDPRVINIEKTNARYITSDTVPESCDLVVMDVSFISQTLLHENAAMLLKDGGRLISLIKPQFEVGRGRIGKGGIVAEKYRLQAVDTVLDMARLRGFVNEGVAVSPITGGDGNTEFLAVFRKTSP